MSTWCDKQQTLVYNDQVTDSIAEYETSSCRIVRPRVSKIAGNFMAKLATASFKNITLVLKSFS